MDAEDYSDFPVNQFEEDNILRELNKGLLAFRQNSTCSNVMGGHPRLERRSSSNASTSSRDNKETKEQKNNSLQRR